MSECSDIILRFIELLAEQQPSISEAFTDNIERQLRHEYGGSKLYIAKKKPNYRDQITQRLNGRNTNKVASEMRVHRSTVYRAAKRREV